MERLRIEGSSLAADMPELNKSTKAAQEAHSENKNEEVAKPELDSDIDYGSMEIIDIASIDLAYLEDMPCYDNLLLDVDEARLIRITGNTGMLGTLTWAHEMIKRSGKKNEDRERKKTF
ncbi:hypothetical protein OROGR_016762 [Orobanche gracilis]